MLGQSLLSMCGPFDKGYVIAIPLFISVLEGIDIIYSGPNTVPGLTLQAKIL
jgi:hypothetical protein